MPCFFLPFSSLHSIHFQNIFTIFGGVAGKFTMPYLYSQSGFLSPRCSYIGAADRNISIIKVVLLEKNYIRLG